MKVESVWITEVAWSSRIRFHRVVSFCGSEVGRGRGRGGGARVVVGGLWCVLAPTLAGRCPHPCRFPLVAVGLAQQELQTVVAHPSAVQSEVGTQAGG